jgi:hypothetical protein
MSETKKTGLDLLREPFPAHQIGKLSKETSKQKELGRMRRALQERRHTVAWFGGQGDRCRLR